jgi:hypothetical protein
MSCPSNHERHLHANSSDQDNLQAQHFGREDLTLDTAMELVQDTDVIWVGTYVFDISNFSGVKSVSRSQVLH